ncbi:MAG: hypothetical protein ABSH53_11940 [Holophaga sp.]|jgi:hypothetical protein
MRRLLVVAGVCAALLGAGLWWATRREPAGAPLEADELAFTAQPSGPGQLIRFQDTQVALRSFRWLPPLPGGALVAQTVTQNDRQRVVLFRDGPVQDSLLVLKPVGVAEPFWRFAVLADAAVAPGGAMILLYQAGDPANREPALVMGVDPGSQQVLWWLRGACERMALAQGSVLYLYGGKNPVLRVQVPVSGAGPARPAPKTIDLAPEVAAVDDLLPTGRDSFLVCHRDGLSAYAEGGGWTHWPAPGEAPGELLPRCRDWKPTLFRAGKQFWWQPAPGSLVQVHRDGSPARAWRCALPDGDPFAPDARLLRALGAEPDGSVWFALASPEPLAPAAAPPMTPTAALPATPAAPPSPGAAAPGTPAPDWGAYATAGLDRLYRWDPAGKTLERVSLAKAWAALAPPPSVQAPGPGQGVAPQAGVLLAEGAGCAWRLPLQALPLERVPGWTETPAQAM